MKSDAEFLFDARVMGGMNPSTLEMAVAPHVWSSYKGGMLNPLRCGPGGEKPELFRKYGEWMGMSTKALDRMLDTPFKVSMPRFLRHTEDLYTTLDDLGVCGNFPVHQYFGMERMAELYSAATGIEMDEFELKRSSERAWNLLKALNVREGFSRKDDKFPPKWLEPLKRDDEEFPMKDILGIKILTSEDLEKMLDDYYDEREWDIKTGLPTREKLEEVGLRDVADDLTEKGILPARRPKGWRVGNWGPGYK